MEGRRGFGRPADPEERCGRADAAHDSGEHTVLDSWRAVVFASIGEAVGQDIQAGGGEDGDDDAGNGRREGDASVCDGEVVEEVQDGGDGDEELEDGREDEADEEGEEDDERLADQHVERVQEGHGGHLTKGDTALGGCEIERDSRSFGSSAEDGTRICVRHADSKEVDGDSEDTSDVLGPSPSTVIGQDIDDEAADQRATRSPDEGSQSQE